MCRFKCRRVALSRTDAERPAYQPSMRETTTTVRHELLSKELVKAAPRHLAAVKCVLPLVAIALLLSAKPSSADASDAQLRAVYSSHAPVLVSKIKTFSLDFFSWQSTADTAILGIDAADVSVYVTTFLSDVRRIGPSSSRGRNAKTLLIKALRRYRGVANELIEVVDPLYDPVDRGEATSRMNIATRYMTIAAKAMLRARRALGV